ncbi:MAG TPA: hypothetical protein VG297_26390 [Bryobacteraceae bacterium]|jgi:hypothetical protein|nr:hypothetical protein [Bryobacteraceae bacterium]
MLRLCTLFLCATLAFTATAGPKTGRLDLKSVGAMAFGPDGILLIGDSLAGAIFAVDTRDTIPAAKAPAIEFKAIDRRIAGMLGVTPADLRIDDVKVNPISKNVYISVTRGSGPNAITVLLRTSGASNLSVFALDNVAYSSALLPNPPASNPRAGYRNPRLETITQLAFAAGKVIVAGLSNEEFSSNLRVIPFPFRAVDNGANIEIFHGSHGEYETRAPVRTFFPWTIAGKQYIVAAYTCTPLVLIPLEALKSGAKVTGTTIAELGMGNRPLDMIPYHKDDHDYILLANSYRGVLKLPAENLDRYAAITEQAQMEGVPFKRIPALRSIRRLTTLDDANALVLKDDRGEDDNVALDLESVPLP